MSRAFVKEPDGSEPEELPDLPVSEERNLVTAGGLKSIQDNVSRYRQQLSEAQAKDDKAEIARSKRDLTYWAARAGTAELIQLPSDVTEMSFGLLVTLEYEDGKTKKFRIVGQDEADPSKGLISYVSPLARNLIGRKVGDMIEAGQHEVEITKIEF